MSCRTDCTFITASVRSAYGYSYSLNRFQRNLIFRRIWNRGMFAAESLRRQGSGAGEEMDGSNSSSS